MAVLFDANSEYVQVNCSSTPIAQYIAGVGTPESKFTIAGWVYMDSSPPATWANLWGWAPNSGNATASSGLASVSSQSNKLYSHLEYDGSDDTGYILPTGEWIYVVWRKRVANNYGYDVLTMAYGQTTLTSRMADVPRANWNSPNYFNVGNASTAGGAPFRGKIAHVRAWNDYISSNTDLAIEGQYATHADAVSAGSSALGTPWIALEFGDGALTTNGGSTSATHTVTVNGATYTAGPTLSGGASVAVSSVSDDTLDNGQTSVTITGSGFKTSQGSGKVIISPTDDVTDVNAVRQFVTTWSSDTSITFTAIRGTLQAGTQYLFVVNDDGDSNTTGYPVSFNGLTPIILRWNM